ncbi:precorrin-6Y C5,15-methyltransferase (decarboxylating) [Methylopila capsulata]|uniref:Precorrin-6Y C5,15-methyltransferase (Decarboxylating) n=1 Tax=Methylopila capsulata TaxID=61654 RepID=A0A9W6IY40_9HYPH|nr:precorrin-6y C5,15-methyltransferase (decarboxylating) subunit CbiE [Methylopila capsulata]MBM7853016.1 precorrin-6Y C5,15-methyltransferase (decarboxylating) [Methylopila capsulata]GLK57772.1 precorrin-6Y C5,15-methyltransferase (decarboxylating) [Methylopila capsulata]
MTRSPDHPRWLTVVGVNEDGLDGLGLAARAALATAEKVVGGARHLELIPASASPKAERHAWPSPMLPFLDVLVSWRGRTTVVLASGDPLLHGVAATLLGRVGPEEMTVLPAPSAFQLACAAMLWPVASTALVTACGRPVESLAAELHDGARIVLFSAGGATPAAAAALLVAHGYGDSAVTVLERLGGPQAAATSLPAHAVGDRVFDQLNTVAIACVAGPDARLLPRVPGLPDDAFANDGQITRREVRALTLARLAPLPGALLWDVGAGSGSIGVEWMRAARGARAIALEPRADRAARARANAARLGVPGLDVREAAAPEGLAGLPRPDAVFLGGGATAPGALEICWAALKPGGRLVANAVTLETETKLLAARGTLGGDLVRLQIANAEPVGRMTGWRPAMPITQFVATKPRT